MKRLTTIILGLLTLSLIILTDKLNLSDSTDKLLCTILWCGWVISALAGYFMKTKGWTFEHEVSGGVIIALGVSYENQDSFKEIVIILPFLLLKFNWTKNIPHNYGT